MGGWHKGGCGWRGGGDIDWMYVAQGGDEWESFVKTAMNIRWTAGEILGFSRNYKLSWSPALRGPSNAMFHGRALLNITYNSVTATYWFCKAVT